MKIGEVGEFGLIDRIKQIIGELSPGVVAGIGDDAAAFRPQPGRLGLLTTDTLVEGVHFHLRYTPLTSLGWKAVAINISDIAAMGGVPRYGVVSLALPKDWEVEMVESLYEGMEQCAMAYGCTLVGGDTVQSKGGCCLTVTILGDVKEDKIVTRDGAQEGDLLCMTGEMGGARVGLEVLESGEDEKRYADSVNRFLEPKPRLWEAKRFVDELDVSSMIDISDGLTSEIGHLCKQSGLGCLVDEQKVPAAGEAVRWAEEKKKPLSGYLLESGEEYELLFTVPERKYERWREKKLDVNMKITVIGEMVDKREGIRVKSEGKVRSFVPRGWNHFNQ